MLYTHIDGLWRLSLLAGVVLCLSLGQTSPSVAQSAGARIRTETSRLEIGSGQLEVLNLVIDGAADVYGVDLRAHFDPALIEVVDTDPQRAGVQMAPGQFLKPDFMVRNVADNRAGTLEYVITQVNPTPPASGSGVVLSILLRGKAEHAPSAFSIDFIEIADRRGTQLPITAQAGELQVVAPRAGQSPAVAELLALLNAGATQPIIQPTLDTAPTPDARAAPSARPAADSSAVVRMEPAALTLRPGEERTVAVVFDQAQDVYGVELRLSYDPNLFELVDTDPAQPGAQSQPAGWLSGGFLAVNVADNTAGVLDFAGTLLNPAPPVGGSQTITTVTVRGKASGSGDLTIAQATLADRAGGVIAARLQGSRITIVADGAPSALQDHQTASESLASARAGALADSLPPLPEWAWAGFALIVLTVGSMLYRRRRGTGVRR